MSVRFDTLALSSARISQGLAFPTIAKRLCILGESHEEAAYPIGACGRSGGRTCGVGTCASAWVPRWCSRADCGHCHTASNAGDRTREVGVGRSGPPTKRTTLENAITRGRWTRACFTAHALRRLEAGPSRGRHYMPRVAHCSSVRISKSGPRKNFQRSATRRRATARETSANAQSPAGSMLSHRAESSVKCLSKV